MNALRIRPSGFTLLELVIVVAVIAILGAIAVLGYQKYLERARGVDIVTRYDAIRTGVAARLQTARADDCAELAKSLDAANLGGAGATLAYGFEAVAGGYRPVLTVCAQAGSNGPQGVGSARGAYETLAKNGVVEKNPVLTDSVVSFALRLTQDDRALCKTVAASAATTCGQTPAQAPPAQVSYPGPTACPAGADRLLVEDAAGVEQWGCFDACPSGQVRQPRGLACVPASTTTRP